MNREIKFRGQRVDNKEWVYGSLSVEYDGACNISYWRYQLLEIENNYGEMVQELIEVIPETVGQYTGFKTDSGIEIYENDKDAFGNTVEFSFGCWNINGDRPLSQTLKTFIPVKI